MERTVGRAIPRVHERSGWSLVGLIVAIKAVVLIGGGIAYQLWMRQELASPRAWLELWNLWDAPHYLDLAQHGYQRGGELGLFIVFYPLYPWLVRLAAAPLGDYLIGAFAVSSVASIIAGLLLYRLVALDEGATRARRAVWFLFIFPTSYVLHIAYTESLFLALAFGSLLAARRRAWLVAGLLGALASATRVNGLLLALALAAEAAYPYWRVPSGERRIDWRWLWIGLVGFGFAGYLLLNQRVTGDPFTFSRILREHWHKSLSWPWAGIRAMIDSWSWRSPREIWAIFVPEVVFILIGLAGTVAAAIKLRPSYAVWMASNWLLFISTSFILSVPRYTLLLFPLAILFARAGDRRLWLALISAASLLALALFTTLFVIRWGGY